MPKPDPVLNLIHTTTHDCTALVRKGGLLDHLSTLTGMSVRNSANENMVRAKGTGSQAPWDSTHAGLYFTIIAEAVELEADLRYRLTGVLMADRGRTHKTGQKALTEIPKLLSGQSDKVVAETAKITARWVRSVGETPGVDTLTRQMRLQAPCWYCKKTTLTVAADASTDVVCRNPACVNPETGKEYRWPRSEWVRLLSQLESVE